MRTVVLLALLVGVQSVRADLKSGLLAHYPFDEDVAALEVRDVTGNGHDGVTNGSPDAEGLLVEQTVVLPPGVTNFRFMNRPVVPGKDVKLAVLSGSGERAELTQDTDYEVNENGVRILKPELLSAGKRPSRVVASYYQFNEPLSREESGSGRALRFDGYNDGVRVAKVDDFDFLTGMTLALWIQPAKRRAPIEILVNGGGLWGLSFYENALVFLHPGIPGDKTPDDERTTFKNFQRPPADSEWTHLAVTTDGSEVRLYVNGVETEVVGERPGNIKPLTSGELRIGGVLEYVYNGLIDDLRIYNRPLSKEEIAELAKR